LKFLEFKNFAVFSNKDISYVLEIFGSNGLALSDRFGDDIIIENRIIPSFLKGLNAVCNEI
jgi:hypothetical protein